MGVFVTGEYGEKTKRPHWHALIFGWSPSDSVYRYSNERGDRVYSSKTLAPFSPDEVQECRNWKRNPLWPHGKGEFGSVTFESAGYCARYSAKKLGHGNDGTHEFEPVSKKSNKNAIGKKWLEKYYKDVFNQGHIVLPDGSTCGIPRYYEKWFKEHKPDEWLAYVTRVKLEKISHASSVSDQQFDDYKHRLLTADYGARPLSPSEVRKIIIESKFKMLQANLKL